MRHFYLAITFLLLNTMTVSAQKSGPLFIGIKGGLSVPNLKSGSTENDWNKDYESRQGEIGRAHV